MITFCSTSISLLMYTHDHIWNGSLTYRKKHRWISEVDLCLVSMPLVGAISHFTVDQNLNILPITLPLVLASILAPV